jgi:prophage regulatory protein
MKRNVVAHNNRPQELVSSAKETGAGPAVVEERPIKLLRFTEVRQRTGLSRTTIWRLEHSGAFPRRISVTVNVVAWREDEVAMWIDSKMRRE